MQFELKTIQAYRGIFLFPIGLPFLLITSLVINHRVSSTPLSILLILIWCTSVIGLIFYLMYGRLIIRIENDALSIEWIKRIPFDLNRTMTIAFDDITKLRVDRPGFNSQRALKIYYNYTDTYTKTHSFNINSYDNRFFRGDMLKLMDYLTELSKLKSIKVIDHWDEWHEKGYLKIAYRINQAITTIAVGVILYTIFTGSFKSKNLILIFCFLPQMYLYGLIMKQKIRPNEK